jgi:hypothetical protein
MKFPADELIMEMKFLGNEEYLFSIINDTLCKNEENEIIKIKYLIYPRKDLTNIENLSPLESILPSKFIK